MRKSETILTPDQQEQLRLGMPVETVDQNGMRVKVLPSLTRTQNRKRNKELKRIKTFGY